MKMKFLTICVLAATCCSAQAATVYDKDGTQLSVGGRVQSVVYNGHYNYAGNHDSSLVNSSRLNIGGQTKVNEWLSAFAFSEWDMPDGNKNKIGDNIKSREQYVGADFKAYGRLLAGKSFDVTRKVLATTDIFEDVDTQNDVGLNGDRRAGMFRYDLNTNGFFASLNYQTSADSIKVFGKSRDVKSGMGGALGYTFDNVLFGPISLKAAYSYLDGQDDNTAIGTARFDNANQMAASLSWGLADNGLYLAGLIYKYETKFDYVKTNSSVKETTGKGFELVAGYTFENGIGLYTGYNHWESEDKNVVGNNKVTKFNRIPVSIKYMVTPNFKLWTEAEFDASSDVKNSSLNSGTQLSAGARYTF